MASKKGIQKGSNAKKTGKKKSTENKKAAPRRRAPKVIIDSRIAEIQNLYRTGREDQIEKLRKKFNVSRAQMARYRQIAARLEKSLHGETRLQMESIFTVRLRELFARSLDGEDYEGARRVLADLHKVLGLHRESPESAAAGADESLEERREQARKYIDQMPDELRQKLGDHLIDARADALSGEDGADID